MSKISDKILNKIKEENIKPTPKWQFDLRDSGMWLVFGLLFALVVIAMGLLMFFWSDGPWLHGRFGMRLFGGTPLFLIIIFALGASLALLDFKNIGRGYRYSINAVILALIIVAIIAGWLFNYLGLSQGLDRSISRAPFYQDRGRYMMQVWQNPNNGLLAGQILEMNNQERFNLQDFEGKKWMIDASKARWRHNLEPEKGLQIKLIGEVDGDNFKAEEIRPWLSSRGCTMGSSQEFCGMRR